MKVNKDTVAIAMATYNGEKYITEQIDSIIANNYENWILFIRDDGSEDTTVKIIDSYSARDSRIKYIKDDRGKLGHAQNFSTILSCIKEQGFNFFALADQDDVWHKNKLTELHKNLLNNTTPALAYSDLQVVNDQLTMIDNSYFQGTKLHPATGRSLNYLLMENHIPGCSIMGNKQLLEVAVPIPETMLNHDWWLALNSAIYGEMRFVDEPLMKYRQHDNNTIGMTSLTNRLLSGVVMKKFRDIVFKLAEYLITVSKLASDRYSPASEEVMRKLKLFIAITGENKSAFGKILLLYKSGFRVHHRIRWIVLFFAFIRVA